MQGFGQGFGMKDGMKDQTDTEIRDAGDMQGAGRVWIAPVLARSMEPLLVGLGIELLEPGARDSATIQVELAAGDAGVSAGRVRIERGGNAAYEKDLRIRRIWGNRMRPSNSKGLACGRRRALRSRGFSGSRRRC